MCGRMTHAEPSDPVGLCRGAPVPRTEGPSIEDHRQPPGAIEKFWSVIIISAVNELPDRVAASHAIQGSAAATSILRLPKPLSRRPASTSSTKRRSCARAKSSIVTGFGATMRMRNPSACPLATTADGLLALGDIELVAATCRGV